MSIARRKIRFEESSNEILIRCLRKDDFTEWNDWRIDNENRRISLKGARLVNVNLAGADFSRIDLEAADLNHTNLSGADLSEANLTIADLSNANLCGADLWKADMKHANLRQADLKRAQLVKANLENAQLVRIHLESADLWKANLKGAKLILITVDRRTFIWGCDVDERTVIHGTNLNLARIEPCLMERMKVESGVRL